MTEDDLRTLLQEVRLRETPVEDAVGQLKRGPFKTSALREATPDHHRRLRHGLCEVILGSSKTLEQIISIARELSGQGTPVLITRLDDEKIAGLRNAFPGCRANGRARTATLNAPKIVEPDGLRPSVAIVTAGTGDLPVAEESAEVCVATATPFTEIADVGVAGLHRILDRIEELEAASALVVVAGMEGALPGVIGGLVGKPIFAVPTSVGYGANLGGIAPLLTMLNSCSPGVTVVNVDNGFSAGYAACRVVAEIEKRRAAAPESTP